MHTHMHMHIHAYTGVEQTWNVKQTDIVAAVDVGAAQKAFDLRLPDLGSYAVDFSRSGRHVLLGGRWVVLLPRISLAQTTRAVGWKVSGAVAEDFSRSGQRVLLGGR